MVVEAPRFVQSAVPQGIEHLREYTVEKLHPNDPLLLVWPKLDRDEMFLCLVLRLRGGVAGIESLALFEEIRAAARASGTVIVRAEIREIVYTTRSKLTQDKLPLAIDNIARAGKPALYRFSDAERWISPKAQEAIHDPTQQAGRSEPRIKGIEVTPIQKRVLDRLAANLSVIQIARELDISRAYVYAIIETLQRTTGAENRKALGRFARQQKDPIVVSQPAQTRPPQRTRATVVSFPRIKVRPPSPHIADPRWMVAAPAVKLPQTSKSPSSSTQQLAVRGAAPAAERTMPTEVREPRHPVLVDFALSLVQPRFPNTMRLMSNDPQVALREAVRASDVFLKEIAQAKTKAEVDATIVSSLIKIVEWAWVAKHGRTFDEQNLLLHASALKIDKSTTLAGAIIDICNQFRHPIPDRCKGYG